VPMNHVYRTDLRCTQSLTPRSRSSAV
jgi:hypothetical protein